jgi:hypothetical protein
MKPPGTSLAWVLTASLIHLVHDLLVRTDIEKIFAFRAQLLRKQFPTPP